MDYRTLNDKDREIRLAKTLERGQRADDLKEFMDEFLKDEERTALERLNTREDSDDIQRDYQAALRVYAHINQIIATAKNRRHKLQEGE